MVNRVGVVRLVSLDIIKCMRCLAFVIQVSIGMWSHSSDYWHVQFCHVFCIIRRMVWVLLNIGLDLQLLLGQRIVDFLFITFRIIILNVILYFTIKILIVSNTLTYFVLGFVDALLVDTTILLQVGLQNLSRTELLSIL